MDKREMDLMERAANEIEELRRRIDRLSAYHAHTERMLALFEGGPRPEQNMGMAEDVAWLLRKAIREQPPSEGER